jgi:hypothetical protein
MKKYLADLLFVAGAAVVVVGLGMIHPVLAVLAAGAALIGLGLLIGSSDRRNPC